MYLFSSYRRDPLANIVYKKQGKAKTLLEISKRFRVTKGDNKILKGKKGNFDVTEYLSCLQIHWKRE